MFKKTLIWVSVIIFIAIFSFHFYLNFKIRTAPPSQEWSKEVLLAEGSIECNPRLIKYKDFYVVAYSDGKYIKILKVDSIGRKIEEKTLPVKEGTVKDIHLLTDNQNLLMEVEVYMGSDSCLLSFKGNEKFEFTEDGKILNILDFVQIDNSTMAVALQDKVQFIDFKNNTTIPINVSKQRFLMGAKHKDEYIICYMKGLNNFEYVRIKNGIVSQPKIAGHLTEITKVNFVKGTMIANDDYANAFIEYKTEGDYSGSKMLTFSLNTEEYKVSDFQINGEGQEIYNVEPFYHGGKTSILATAERDFGKKKQFSDIVEYDEEQGAFVKATPLSRSGEISLYASAAEDTVTFCDIVGKNDLKLFMVSSREEFKKANGEIRGSEIKGAFSDTINSCFSSLGYIVIYGVFWIIPSIAMAGIVFMVEYKLNFTWKKVLFVAISALGSILKCKYIYNIIFVENAYKLPSLLNPYLGLGICLAISLLFYYPAYKKYVNEEENILIAPYSISLLLESLFTVMLFRSFLV